MELKMTDLFVLFSIYPSDNYVGFTDKTEEQEANSIKGEEIRNRLITNGLIELDDDMYRISSLGQHILKMISVPDAYIEIKNLKTTNERKIYSKGIDYLCIECYENKYLINLLPALPLAVGAYASAIEGVRKYVGKESLEDAWYTEDISYIIYGTSQRKEIKMSVVETEDGSVMRVDEPEGTAFKLYSESECVNEITAWLLDSLREVQYE